MNLEFHFTITLAFYICLLLIVIFIIIGIRQILNSRNLPYFRKRRDMAIGGWRLILSAILLVGFSFFLNRYAEPVIYLFFEPSPTFTRTPTITLTPSITLTPTITLSPTITLTPLVSNTPSPTSTPMVPMAVEAQFQGLVTPNPNAVFSPIQFARNIDFNFQPINPDTTFRNPIQHIYGLFSFDGMLDGSQWSALWYRDGELVFYESYPWNGGTGGYGYTDWAPDPSEWLAGEYEVQLFNGSIWKQSGFFTVTGNPPTVRPSATPSFTPTLSPTATLTRTPTATRTLRPTSTPVPTRTATRTRTPSPTRPPTLTRTPSATSVPTETRTPTP
jgi:hypothetical protein